jgi:hypothetical protein
MSDMVAVYRAPMRSRDDDVDVAATIARARARSVCGFGERGVAAEKLDGRIGRFAAAPDGSFVWTRDPDGLFWLGRLEGTYRCDTSTAATEVDLVHVRPCRWLREPLLEPQVPAAVLATYRRGGRNFQQTHDPEVGAQSLRLWEATSASGRP